MIKMLHIVEKEDISPLVKSVFSDEFFAKLNCLNPPPILFKKAQPSADWVGYCQDFESTESGEIVIDQSLINNPGQLKIIYVHETAHRLLPHNNGHSAQFFCLNYVLLLRVGMQEFANLYDIGSVAKELIPSAISLILQGAEELANSDMTAEALALYILKHLSNEKIEAKHSELQNLKNKMESYKQAALQNYFLFFGAGLASTFFLPWLWKVVVH